jgi:hypothetical protein
MTLRPVINAKSLEGRGVKTILLSISIMIGCTASPTKNIRCIDNWQAIYVGTTWVFRIDKDGKPLRCGAE